jgi:hypothetical protein
MNFVPALQRLDGFDVTNHVHTGPHRRKSAPLPCEEFPMFKKIAIAALVLGLLAVSPASAQTTPPATTPHAGTSKANEAANQRNAAMKNQHDAEMKKRMGEMKAQRGADMKTHEAAKKAHHDAEAKQHLAKAQAHHAEMMKRLKATKPAPPPAQ